MLIACESDWFSGKFNNLPNTDDLEASLQAMRRLCVNKFTTSADDNSNGKRSTPSDLVWTLCNQLFKGDENE